jgi:hypothetical protein
MEGIDNFDIMDAWDSVLRIAEMFHVVPSALIMLLFDSLQSFSCGRTHVCALEVEMNMAHS